MFTRRWVVDLILDLVGYRADRDLAQYRATDPACGSGAFLTSMVARLCESITTYGHSRDAVADAISAVDVQPRNVALARRTVASALVEHGWGTSEAEVRAATWVRSGDYLLDDTGPADFVVGNPPYVRLEDVPDQRMDAYRNACETMNGRADVYVGFFERGLSSLKPEGVLGFICADRWMRNQYGKQLRQVISDNYAVDVTIEMHDADAFEAQVSAYPAITIIRRGEQASTVVATTNGKFGPKAAASLTSFATSPDGDAVVDLRSAESTYDAARLSTWFTGSGSWPTGTPVALRMVEELNERFGPLENLATATRVSIGVATGADKVFITRDSEVAEPERMLPLSVVADTKSGTLNWSGNHLVNPWDADRALVNLEDWPGLAAYYEQHSDALLKRHVAGKRPQQWYRTIDPVNPTLAARDKLLFPDMKMTSSPVYDPGGTYPHHNLYYVISDGWDLRVLGGLLFSRICDQTVAAYCVKMRGGTLRFQAQYLRRIRVPDPATISSADAQALAAAFDARDVDAATEAALPVYNLDTKTEAWIRSLSSH